MFCKICDTIKKRCRQQAWTHRTLQKCKMRGDGGIFVMEDSRISPANQNGGEQAQHSPPRPLMAGRCDVRESCHEVGDGDTLRGGCREGIERERQWRWKFMKMVRALFIGYES